MITVKTDKYKIMISDKPNTWHNFNLQPNHMQDTQKQMSFHTFSQAESATMRHCVMCSIKPIFSMSGNKFGYR